MYADAVAAYGSALGRLSRGYEVDGERRRDLLQDIHLALWQSLDRFDARCSLRTWTYRVAHTQARSSRDLDVLHFTLAVGERDPDAAGRDLRIEIPARRARRRPSPG